MLVFSWVSHKDATSSYLILFDICPFIVATGGLDRDRLSFYFTHFDMGDDCGSGESWLEVADGGDPRDTTAKPKPIPGKNPT